MTRLSFSKLTLRRLDLGWGDEVRGGMQPLTETTDDGSTVVGATATCKSCYYCTDWKSTMPLRPTALPPSADTRCPPPPAK